MITKKYYKLVKVSYEDSGYFYFENVSNQTGTLSILKEWTPSSWSGVEYSTDGVNWNSYDLSTLPTILVSAYSKVYLRGSGNMGNDSNDSPHYYFNMDVDHIVGGNVLSLIKKNSFLTDTTLQAFCLNGIFLNDTHLLSAEKLNFGNLTTLSFGSFTKMFRGCSALTTSPELPATTLANSCYSNMFNGCSSLNTVKCLATDISASNCTNNWLSGVSATGTFYKAASMNDWTSGPNGIPSGWTVVDA